jgi:hypothetical protein
MMQTLILDLLKLKGALTIRDIVRDLQTANPTWTSKDRQALKLTCLHMLNDGVAHMDSHYRMYTT